MADDAGYKRKAGFLLHPASAAVSFVFAYVSRYRFSLCASGFAETGSALRDRSRRENTLRRRTYRRRVHAAANPLSRASCAQITFTDTITPPNNYSVNYTNDNPPPAVDANYFTTAQAQRIANSLSNSNAASTGNPNGYHNGYVNLGFSASSFGGAGNVNIFNCGLIGGCDSGNAPADRIQMPAGNYLASAEPCLRLVIGHELFHHVQYAYINFSNWSAWGTAPVEGGARVMQDKVYSDLDSNSGCITCKGATADWLNTPDQNVWISSYTFALFWNYLMEQLGVTNTEPQIGVDFMQNFWQRTHTATNAGNIDFPGTLRNTIASVSTARTLEELYQDFAIANYTKLMDVSSLPNSSRYKYKDENEASGDVYIDVAKAISTPLDFGGVSGNVSVSMWGTEYYVVRPSWPLYRRQEQRGRLRRRRRRDELGARLDDGHGAGEAH
jgi:hypothetical protein